MSELNQAICDLLTAWGVDGEHALTSVADRAFENKLVADVLRDLDIRISIARAEVLAMEALRRAIEQKDIEALAAMRDKDTSAIEDWAS